MDTPLNELLSRALLGITRAYEAADPKAPPLPMLMLDGNLDTLSKRARITVQKRLQKFPITAADRAGALVTLAKAEKQFGSLRAPLVALVDRFELELPHYWCTYGTADPTVTGGRYRPGQEGPPRIPPHGADWAPVLRDGKGAAELTLTALLSQALCNFAVDYETQGPPLGWTILGVMSIDAKRGTPMAEVHRMAHLSGDGKSGLERHGLVKVGPKPQQLATLTPLGQRVVDAYATHVVTVEERWREVYGDARVTKLRAVLEKVAPPGPKHPHLNWIPDLREDSD